MKDISEQLQECKSISLLSDYLTEFKIDILISSISEGLSPLAEAQFMQALAMVEAAGYLMKQANINQLQNK